MKTVGERIRQARVAKGLSGEALARSVGYKNQSAIGNIENRPTGTGGKFISAIARQLTVPLDWLLNGPDDANIPWLPPMVVDLETPYSTLANSSEPPMAAGPRLPEPIHLVALDAWTAEAIRIMQRLRSDQKPGAIAHLRTYVSHLGPPSHGQALPMAHPTSRAA